MATVAIVCAPCLQASRPSQPRSRISCTGVGFSPCAGSVGNLQQLRSFAGQKLMKGFSTEATKDDVGSVEWMSHANPYEVLGVSAECSEQDIKDAFRARVKEYHPDVYKGYADAGAITQRLIRAYELLCIDTSRPLLRRRDADPFEEPECVAEDVFVNEQECIGKGCPYSCVKRAPRVFTFASDTGRARAVAQGKGAEYSVYTAAGQCPRNCIYFVTPLQRLKLEEILQRAVESGNFSDDIAFLLEGLIARAKFENGRYQPPKRQPKSSEKWLDWY